MYDRRSVVRLREARNAMEEGLPDNDHDALELQNASYILLNSAAAVPVTCAC